LSIDDYGAHDDGTRPPGTGLPEAAVSPPRRGLPWERRGEQGPGAALLQTIREVVFSPTSAFATMRRRGGWGEPLGFAVLTGSIFIWVAQAWDLLTRSVMVGMPGFEMQDIATANAQEVFFALLAPFIVVAATFFGAAIVHGLLLVFGGAPQPYETTFRVMCYSWAVGVFNLLPICGVFIGFVWRIVVQIIGVREAQEVPGGRAAAAVLVPVVFACMCLVMLTMLALSVAGLSQMGI
jgi:hypothetical protein